ncbi:hypothetical protein [Frigoriflavimonas asaccharolytica]|uniref:Uncharacterized protein n=1 Tax=Frigoriflavimonas asaccharolytica TaxID=2735899 RepID=A0A8J8G980_9FLAO|nr:hypothetical protein [Frigoriflavimonas asaccharolytica]NRS92277.1 hypothetical protein [Frigoriflavimonas asaccharolytica]
MKSSFLLFFAISIFGLNLTAQSKSAGFYKISSGNPDDGGYNWFLFEDHQFAMLTFGTLISGTWEENDHQDITFIPNAPKEKFEVFGRRNEALKGSKIIFLNLDINENSYIGFSSDALQPILNEDANCLDQPIVKVFDENVKALFLSNFTSENNVENKKAYQINLENNNEFIISYNENSRMLAKFTGKIEKNKLTIDFGKKSSERGEIEPSEALEIKKYINQQKKYYAKNELIINAENRFLNLLEDNEGMEGHRSLYKNNYNFDSKTQIYTAKSPDDFEDKYDDTNTLYLYKNLSFSKVIPSKLSSKKNLLQYTCYGK